MTEWIQGGYDGLFDYGVKHTDDYQGYVVRTNEETGTWFAYSHTRGEGHAWIAEGTKEEVMRALKEHKGTADTRYTVATYSYACTAYVRTTLRRALELQSTHNVWAGSEYVNAAKAMVPNTYVTCKLPDETTWELTKLELMTIHLALEWRKAKRMGTRVTPITLVREWAHIEEEIYRVLKGIWHSEGKYWM